MLFESAVLPFKTRLHVMCSIRRECDHPHEKSCGRTTSDGSQTSVLLLKLKLILFTGREEIVFVSRRK